MIKHSLSIILLFVCCSLNAQDIGFGFRAGLNFNSIKGDSEMSGGMDIEEYTNNSGFHVGATFTWAATELMGLRVN